MSAVVSSEDETGNSKANPIDLREGDWKAYLFHSKKQHDESTLIATWGSLIAYKRACTLAYLGRRAQLRGGVCSTNHPHILTTDYVASLEASNKTQRYSRYPWLQSLMTVLAEIERIQDEISSTSNVISMVAR